MADDRRRNDEPAIEEGGRDPSAPVWTHNRALGELPAAPATPGGTSSPQKPGQMPDQLDVPGQARARAPRVDRVVRPLTQAGSAQEIMGVYAPKPGAEMDPARFEQATASYEEMRKAYPAQLPPQRPAPGWALETGDALASEQQATGGAMPEPALPLSEFGEVAHARPGGGTEALGEAARTDASAAEVGSAHEPSDAPASTRSPDDATRDLTDGTGALGTSRLGQAAPSPGDLTNPAGVLPAADEGPREAADRSRGEPAGPDQGGWRPWAKKRRR